MQKVADLHKFIVVIAPRQRHPHTGQVAVIVLGISTNIQGRLTCTVVMLEVSKVNLVIIDINHNLFEIGGAGAFYNLFLNLGAVSTACKLE